MSADCDCDSDYCSLVRGDSTVQPTYINGKSQSQRQLRWTDGVMINPHTSSDNDDDYVSVPLLSV